MELAFSPDLPAWVCYLIVLVVGFVAAARRVHSRLQSSVKKDSVPVWRFWRSWFLLLAYTAVALSLFWLLDRTDAIHDTSLFAALIVALAFERILAGSHGSLSVPESVAGIWSPFQTFADRSVEKITKQVHHAAEKFDRAVIESLSDPQCLAALKRLAMRATSDEPGLTTALAGFEGERARKGDDYYFELTGRTLLEAIRTSVRFGGERWERLLYEEQVIKRSKYYRVNAVIRSRTFAAVGFLTFGAALIGGGYALHGSSYWNYYYLWRIEKSNTTVSDLHRTRNALRLQLAEAALAARTYDSLIDLVRQPELQIERANAVLGLLLELRCQGAAVNYPLQSKLISALRTDNVDIRNRINQVLVFMTPESEVNPLLKQWNPSEGEATTEVESKVELWQKQLAGMRPTASCNVRPPRRPDGGASDQPVNTS